jgi:hypothetical protein
MHKKPEGIVFIFSGKKKVPDLWPVWCTVLHFILLLKALIRVVSMSPYAILQAREKHMVEMNTGVL